MRAASATESAGRMWFRLVVVEVVVEVLFVEFVEIFLPWEVVQPYLGIDVPAEYVSEIEEGQRVIAGIEEAARRSWATGALFSELGVPFAR